MFRFDPPVTLRLEQGRLLHWRRQRGVRLRVLAGTAWVTQMHDMEDHFLRPGATLALRPGSRALIGAEQDVALRFESDGRGAARALWQALSDWLRRPRPAAELRRA